MNGARQEQAGAAVALRTNDDRFGSKLGRSIIVRQA